MAFFMLENLKEIGHFSRLHGYNGKLVISFIKEKSSILNKETTIWVQVSGIISPFRIQEIKELNKNKLVVSLLNVNKIKAEELKNKSIYINPIDINLPEEKFDKNNISGYSVTNQNNEILGDVNSVIDIKNNNLIQIYIDDIEVLLPFNKQNIILLDHSKKLVKVQVPDGLIELYTNE